MDVYVGLLFSMLLLCSSAHPMVQERDGSEINDEVVETTTAANFEVTTPSIATPKNCTTGRDSAGACVMRAHCGYSTNAVDRTLYARRNYVKPCAKEEVCCPFEYVISGGEDASETNQKLIADDNAAFEFDDDD